MAWWTGAARARVRAVVTTRGAGAAACAEKAGRLPWTDGEPCSAAHTKASGRQADRRRHICTARGAWVCSVAARVMWPVQRQQPLDCAVASRWSGDRAACHALLPVPDKRFVGASCSRQKTLWKRLRVRHDEMRCAYGFCSPALLKLVYMVLSRRRPVVFVCFITSPRTSSWLTVHTITDISASDTLRRNH